jgi:hypothetical protein
LSDEMKKFAGLTPKLALSALSSTTPDKKTKACTRIY